jgi:predicted 2-oxoglutarate/Fe(II)-dependent dioxygenase YbiX
MSQLTDYIKVYDVCFPENFLEELLSEYASMFTPAVVIGKEYFTSNINYDARNCQIVSISKNINNIPERIRLDAIICDKVTTVLKQYNREYPHMLCSTDQGYDLLRYNKGGFHKEHVDQHYDTGLRSLGISFILNDDYEGGEFAFFNSTYLPVVKKNQCIIFPSNFMFPHQIQAVTKGTRHSIITWVA